MIICIDVDGTLIDEHGGCRLGASDGDDERNLQSV